MTKFLQSATILEVKDIKASEAFYREKLGFPPGLFFGEPRPSAS
jgi:catechol 2,3-dioxygenase-like lactoylglutathione lyase family enzyme